MTTIHKTRPLDTLQHIISSFKQFEKKLDKLQEDVKYHGHTLSELRVMVANLSGGNLANPDEIQIEPKRLNKTMQFGDNMILEGLMRKTRKTVHPLNSKVVTKSDDLKHMNKAASYRTNKISENNKTGLAYKRALRHRKSDSTRKPASPKDRQNKRTRLTQQILPS